MTRRLDPSLVEASLGRLLQAAWPHLPPRERYEARDAARLLGLDVAELLPPDVLAVEPPAPRSPSNAVPCAQCGHPMPPHVGGGRARQYCSDACRQAANRGRRAREAEIAAYLPDPDPEIAALVALFDPDGPGPYEPPEPGHLDEVLDAFGYMPEAMRVLVDQFGRVLDGWHLLAALRRRGLEPICETVPMSSDREFLRCAAIALLFVGAPPVVVELRERINRALGREPSVVTVGS